MDKKEITLNRKAWFRYMARSIDMTFGGLIVGLIFGLLLGIFSLLIGNYLQIRIDILTVVPEFVLGIIVMFIYLIIEASIISSFKTTIGKSLFGITVTDGENNYLEFTVAFKRNILLWVKGMAISIPLISLFTLALSYQNYTDKGVTSWDEDNNTIIHFKEISTIKMIFGILFFIFTLALSTYFLVAK